MHVVARLAHISKRGYPRPFRHSLAAKMLIRGAHIRAINERLGHAFAKVTMVYPQAVPVAMQAQYRFFAPCYLWHFPHRYPHGNRPNTVNVNILGSRSPVACRNDCSLAFPVRVAPAASPSLRLRLEIWSFSAVSRGTAIR